jgi:hypothetical protein
LLLPIVPVLSLLSPRYVFVLSLVLYLSVVLAMGRTLHARPGLLLAFCLGLLGSGLGAGHAYMKSLEPQIAEHRSKGQFMLYHDNPQAVLVEDMPHWLSAYLDLREMPGPDLVSSYCEALSAYTMEQARQKTYFRYRADRLVEHPPLFEICQAPEGLHTEFSYLPSSHELTWQLGPYSAEQGQYYFAFENTHQFIPVPIRGQLPVLALSGSNYLGKPILLSVKYIAYSGWETPAMRLNLKP